VQIVAVHVAKGLALAKDITNELTVPTYGANDEELGFMTKGPKVMVEGAPESQAATITKPDILVCSGAIHMIDKVLLPVAVGPEAANGPMSGAMADAPGPAGACMSIAEKITAPNSPTKLLAGIAETVCFNNPQHTCYLSCLNLEYPIPLSLCHQLRWHVAVMVHG
jgi:hypothetical protein